MAASLIERLSVVERFGGDLWLRRAWPRAPGHLLLEYTDSTGSIVAGQWMADAAALRTTAKETARKCPRARPVHLAAQGVLLQPRGGDRKLVDLPAILARRGATLLSHRPERRAVARLRDERGTRYARVLRPSRFGRTLAAARFLLGAADDRLALPKILEADERRGIVVWSALAGRSLHRLLGDEDRLVPALRASGEALRALHALPAPPGAAAHGAGAERDLLREDLALLEDLDREAHDRIAAAAGAVCAGLEGTPCGEATLHRDLHDKQIMIDARGRPGLLDLDTCARGEPALDLGNMLAHLELRVMQGRCAPPTAARAGAAFLEGYDPPVAVLARVPPYRAAALLRLACLYSYRPRWRHLGRTLALRAAAAMAAAHGQDGHGSRSERRAQARIHVARRGAAQRDRDSRRSTA